MYCITGAFKGVSSSDILFIATLISRMWLFMAPGSPKADSCDIILPAGKQMVCLQADKADLLDYFILTSTLEKRNRRSSYGRQNQAVYGLY